MTLDEFLEQSGWSKSAVARKCGVSRAALTKWDVIPDQHAGVLAEALLKNESEPKAVRKCHPCDLSHEELGEIIRTRSKTTDWDICQEHGWRVWEFSKAMDKWAEKELGR